MDTVEATNAIEVRVPSPPRYPRASDGKVHLEYDVVTTNVMTAPVSLTSLMDRSGDTELAGSRSPTSTATASRSTRHRG